MGQLAAADRAHTAAIDDGRFGRHRLSTSGWHTQHRLRSTHGWPLYGQRRTAPVDFASAPDKRGTLASVTPKTLRPTGFAGLHSSQRPSLVEKPETKDKSKKEKVNVQWVCIE